MEEKEEISEDRPETRWFIDVDWYQQNNRSLLVLAQNYLCPKCAKQLSDKGKEIPLDNLLTTIKNCCSQTPGYINSQLPIMESIFRLFLANGNQPLSIEELGSQVSEWRGSDNYRTSAEIISHLIKRDDYYGLAEAEG
ncbi:hypothetical protein ACFLXD_06575 [Chloroflexota bacterium]